MNIKNTLGRVAGIAAAVAICWLSLTGVASASAARPHLLPLSSSNCAIQTAHGFYLTAVGGGGRNSDVIHTDATQIQGWELFNLIGIPSQNPLHYAIRTRNLHYLTAVGGGGRTTDVIHSDATQVHGWEQFFIFPFEDSGNDLYGIATSNGHRLTSEGGGGRITDTIHSDATNDLGFDQFTITCDHIVRV